MKDFYTTCEIAKFCGVSRITVKNWLEKKALPYFRTSGGHRRVKRGDLMDYLRNKNYPLDEFYRYEEEMETKKKNLYCWEYFSKNFTGKHSEKCNDCLVRETKTLNCYTLVREVGRERIHCERECDTCEYKEKYDFSAK